MIRLMMMLAAVSLLQAQSPVVTQGADIYKVTCGVAYCHGSGGSAGRAPQLAGRGFDAQFVFNTVVNGKAGTAMPGFARQLKSEEIEAVTQYILSLPRLLALRRWRRRLRLWCCQKRRKKAELCFSMQRE